MVFGQSIFQELQAFLWRIGHLEQFEVWWRDHADVDHGVEIDDFLPVRAAIDDNDNLFSQLLSLGKGEDFKKFVERTEASGKDNQRFGQIREPELTHEKVMELEVERRRDIGIRILLERQIDVEADGLSASFVSAKICRFHDARASAGGDDKAMALGRDLGGPFGQQEGKPARVFVVASHVNGGLGAFHLLGLLCGGNLCAVAADCGQTVAGIVAAVDAGGAEEDDRILNLLAAKARKRFAVLGLQAQNPAVRTVEEWFVLISEWSGFEFLISHNY